MVCGEKTNLRCVTHAERLETILIGRVFVPDGARVCKTHPNSEEFWKQAWDTAYLNQYNPKQIEDMVDLARTARDQPSSSTIDIPNYTGLSNEKFVELQSFVPTVPKNALLMFLIRLRKALTFEHIGTLFGVSRKTVSRQIEMAREALEKDFVPKFVGFANLDRDLLLRNTTKSARLLHCNNDPDVLIIIADGTYIYCEKSANYEFQKLTFSGQKNRNFVRPMVCVTTNGYIIDILGPFEAVKNDAKCMKSIFEFDPEVHLN